MLLTSRFIGKLSWISHGKRFSL